MPRARRIKFSTPFKHHFRPDDLIALLLRFDRRARYYYKESFLFPSKCFPSLSSLGPHSRVTLIINAFFAMCSRRYRVSRKWIIAAEGRGETPWRLERFQWKSSGTITLLDWIERSIILPDDRAINQCKIWAVHSSSVIDIMRKGVSLTST